VSEDLGTWPAEQATVLLDVLQKAGLSPQAKRSKGGVTVTVPDDESDEAHRQLVANMDAIANAARRPKPAAGQRARRPRPVKGADHPAEKDPSQLASERLKKVALPVAVVLVALLVFGTLGRVQPILGIVVVGALIYFLGRRAQQRGDEDGRGGPGRL
jgi:hypothetical protein